MGNNTPKGKGVVSAVSGLIRGNDLWFEWRRKWKTEWGDLLLAKWVKL